MALQYPIDPRTRKAILEHAQEDDRRRAAAEPNPFHNPQPADTGNRGETMNMNRRDLIAARAEAMKGFAIAEGRRIHMANSAPAGIDGAALRLPIQSEGQASRADGFPSPYDPRDPRFAEDVKRIAESTDGKIKHRVDGEISDPAKLNDPAERLRAAEVVIRKMRPDLIWSDKTRDYAAAGLTDPNPEMAPGQTGTRVMRSPIPAGSKLPQVAGVSLLKFGSMADSPFGKAVHALAESTNPIDKAQVDAVIGNPAQLTVKQARLDAAAKIIREERPELVDDDVRACAGLGTKPY
jgi:hypothetical protein